MSDSALVERMPCLSPADKLAALLSCRTVSEPTVHDAAAFTRLRATLETLFPLLHRAAPRIELADGSLLWHWPGADAARPLLLMAHHDVVPVGGQEWTRPPFEGRVEDGYVHGRGALDDKGPLVCLLEAGERLAARGFIPAQDVWVFSGADEETVGRGARMAAGWLRARGVRPWLVSDEGGAVVERSMFGSAGAAAGAQTNALGAEHAAGGTVAAVAIAEKGTVDVRIAARAAAGHSSVPMPGGAAERLAEAVLRISRAEPIVRLSTAVRAMREALGVSDGSDEEILAEIRGAGGELAAMVQTTMAVTRLTGSDGDNVIPAVARATINVRLVPGDDRTALAERLRALLVDLDIEVEEMVGDDPSPTSATAGAAWELMRAAIVAAFPHAQVVPYLQSGSTDSRSFVDCPHVYRFAPLEMPAEDRARIHGPDERVAVSALDAGIRFYEALLTRLS